MRNLLIRWGILTVAIGLTAKLVGGLHVIGGFWAYVWVAALFGLVNAILGPILRFIALPFTILTLGLFALIVNAALLGITAALSSHLAIKGFWTAVLAGLLITVFSALLNRVFIGRRPSRWRH
jgi:putative membrane protein